VADMVARSLPTGPNTRLLDAGCGEGILLAAVANRMPSLALVGADSSAEALMVARTVVPQAELIAAALPALPFPDDSFDLVLCTEVLEHLIDPAAAVTELLRVARGPVILSVPNEPWFRFGNLVTGRNIARFGNDPGHIQHWSARRFVRFVGTIVPVSKITTSFPWTIIVADKRE
jgi:ubiquinone/menaquinone biosynthesis C-methylase UbiE